jgi:peptide/nickel transport system substrate-binding protein
MRGVVTKLRRIGVMLGVVSVLVLDACTGTGGDSTTEPRPSNGTAAPVAGPARLPHRLPPATPIPGATSGGTVRVLSDYGFTTLDPTEAYYTSTVSILSGLLIRSLTQYVYDPRSRSTVLVPDLATDLGRPSHDYRTWRFTLRPGIRFENGRRVTAADLAFGIERSLDRATFPEGADYSNEYFLDGHTYRGPYRSAHYRGVVVHGRTVTIRMAKPFPDMPYWGTFPAMSPIPAGKASDPATYQDHPWATGPYMIENYSPDASLTLVRNPYWRADTDPGRHQYVDRFVFDLAARSADIDSALLADSPADRSTISMVSIAAADYPAFQQEAPNRLVSGNAPCTRMWFPDNRTITDIAVRRALAYAYPYQAAWRVQGEIPGVTRFPAASLMAPGIAGRVPYNPLPGHRPGTTEPAKARALLKRAGELGYRIRFAYPRDDPMSVTLERLYVRALTSAGFTVQAIPSTLADYNTDVIHNPDSRVNLRSVGWCADWPTGGAWGPPVFQTPDTATASPFTSGNLEYFSQPSVDTRIADVETMPLARQPAAWNALARQIQTRYFPVVVTAYDGVALMRGSTVHHDYVDPNFGMPTWKDLWVG